MGVKVKMVGSGGGGRGEGVDGEEIRALCSRNWRTRRCWMDWAREKGVMPGRWMCRRIVGADI